MFQNISATCFKKTRVSKYFSHLFCWENTCFLTFDIQPHVFVLTGYFGKFLRCNSTLCNTLYRWGGSAFILRNPWMSNIVFNLSNVRYSQWAQIRLKIIRLTRKFLLAQMVVPYMGMTVWVVKKFPIVGIIVYGPPKLRKSVFLP